MKRGQVTMFILLGVLLLLAFGVIAFFLYQTQTTQFEVEQERVTRIAAEGETAEFYISTCLHDVAQRAVRAIALNGGYLSVVGAKHWGEPGDGLQKKAHYIFAERPLAYLFNGETITLRDKGTIEKMMAQYIIVEFEKCVDFSVFENQDFTVQKPDIPWQAINFDFRRAVVPYSRKNVASAVKINDKNVVATIEYPFTLTRDGSVSTYDRFSSTVDLRLGIIYTIAENLLENIEQHEPYDISEDCEDYKTDDQLVNIYFTPNAYQKNYALSIVDAQPLEKAGAPLRFQFAVKNTEVTGECVG
jgi:hypothetical protein